MRWKPTEEFWRGTYPIKYHLAGALAVASTLTMLGMGGCQRTTDTAAGPEETRIHAVPGFVHLSELGPVKK